MAHLMSQDYVDTGLLVLLPNHAIAAGEEERGVEYVREFVKDKLLRPIHAMVGEAGGLGDCCHGKGQFGREVVV